MVGSYDASTGTWTNGATYSLTRNGNAFAVTGTIPYGQADPMFSTPGNRFAIRIYNSGIDERSDLPTGIIAKVTNTDFPSGYNTGRRNEFEDDGSFIAVFAITAATKNAYVREVKIKWFADDADFTTYTFDLSAATLTYPVTTTITNGTKTGATSITSTGTATVNLSANEGYVLPSSVVVTGASHTYDSTAGAVALSTATGPVAITAVCEAAPSPAGLTAFAANQVIGGYDLGDVSNGDTNNDIATFLSGLTYTDGMCVLVSSNGEVPLVAAMDLSDSNFGGSGYALSVSHDQGGEVVYATAVNNVEDESYDGPPTTIGYQNLTDGKYTINTTYTVGTVADTVSGWNGTLIGAVVAE